MSLQAFVLGYETYAGLTESAGTAIEKGIKGNPTGRLALQTLLYTGAGTAHTLSLMYAEGTGSRNTVDGDTSSGQKDVDTVDDPKDPAGNAAASDDVVAYQLKDGSWEFNTVDSVSSKTITLNNNIGAPGIADGAKINIIGAQGDGAEFQLSAEASAQKEFKGEPYLVAPYFGEPLWFHSPNGTDAGTLNEILFAVINK
jgi:hypothetical protein